MDAVKGGTMTGTVLNDAQGQAAKAVECMEALLSGTTYAEGEQSVYVDYVKVTGANVAEFMDEAEAEVPAESAAVAESEVVVESAAVAESEVAESAAA